MRATCSGASRAGLCCLLCFRDLNPPFPILCARLFNRYPATIAAIDAHTGQLTVNWDDGDSSFREIPALEGVPAVRSCRPPTPLSPNVDFAVADDSLVESTCVESRAYQNGQDCSAINNISGLSAAGNFSQQCQAAFSHFSGVCKLYKSVCTTNHTAGSDAHAAVYLLSNMSPDTSQSETIESSNVRSDSNISSAEQVAQIQVGGLAFIYVEHVWCNMCATSS